MAKIVLITGPQAVGKMTVGQELSKITDLKLLHNHMTIDLVSHFFSYGTEVGQRLVSDMRKMIEQRPLFPVIYNSVKFFP